MPARSSRPAAPPPRPAGDYAAHDLHVALLRGVNVGAKKVNMAELKAVAASLGFGAPATLLNSGNLVYRSPALSTSEAASQLRAAIAASLGVRCNVLVRTARELDAVLADCPFTAEAARDGARLLVTLWDKTATEESLQRFASAPYTVERCHVGSVAVYHWLPDGISESKPYEVAARALGEHITARNWNTMQKLAGLLHAMAPAPQ